MEKLVIKLTVMLNLVQHLIKNSETLKQVQGDRHKAFTLAEVLITLTIIGVIAALTIPNLMQRYQEHATVNKVKKFYSTLTNAYSQAVKENGPADEWGIKSGSGESESESSIKIYEILIKPYFKVAKDCGLDNKGKCVVNEFYKFLNGSTTDSNYATKKVYYKVTLNDGSTVIALRKYASSSGLYVSSILLDTNGIKGPNCWGKDMFEFFILADKIVPLGEPQIMAKVNSSSNSFDNDCAKSSQKGYGCSAWLIYKGNMDYLHCNDLTWDGKNKCSK